MTRVYTHGWRPEASRHFQHSIEPRATLIEIRGLDQKSMPTYEPGYSTATGIDPGYERRTG